VGEARLEQNPIVAKLYMSWIAGNLDSWILHNIYEVENKQDRVHLQL